MDPMNRPQAHFQTDRWMGSKFISFHFVEEIGNVRLAAWLDICKRIHGRRGAEGERQLSR